MSFGSSSPPQYVSPQQQNAPQQQRTGWGTLAFGQPSAPQPGPYQQAAQAQGASGQQAIGAQTQANRPDQNSPFASTTWTRGPDGQWHQNTGFVGPLSGTATDLERQAAQAMGSMDWSKFGKVDDGSGARDQAIQGAYGQATSRLDPQFAQREEAEKAQLAAQGLDPSSQAYKTEMGNFDRSRNDAYSSAMNGAIQQGTAAQQATFGENMASRNQSIMEALKQRGMPMQDLLQMQGLLGQQGFQRAGAWQPTDYLGAAQAQGQNNLGQQDQNNRTMGSAMGGVGGFLGSLFGFI